MELIGIVENSLCTQQQIQQPGREGAEKYEIYEAAFGSHLFMTYFYGGGGGVMAPRLPPGSVRK